VAPVAFPRFTQAVNPDEAIAYGATLHAAHIYFGSQLADVKYTLLDVTAFSLGVDTTTGMSNVVVRNSPIPIRSTRDYLTVRDNQSEVSIDIYQGENVEVSKNHSLGCFNLAVPPMPKGEAKIAVTFELDSSGLLKVTAVSKKDGASKSLQVKVNNNSLAYDEIVRLAALNKDLTKKTKKKKTAIPENQFGLD